MQQRQAERPIPLAETEDALVIVNRGGFKGRMGFGFDLECRTHAGNGANRQIRRQAELCPDIHVAGVLDFYLVGGVLTSGDIGNEVTGISKGHERGVQFGALLWSWRQFAVERVYSIHRIYCITCDSHM